jgi:hypothetical protein
MRWIRKNSLNKTMIAKVLEHKLDDPILVCKGSTPSYPSQSKGSESEVSSRNPIIGRYNIRPIKEVWVDKGRDIEGALAIGIDRVPQLEENHSRP